MGLKGLVTDTNGIPVKSATIQVKKARNLVEIKHDITTGGVFIIISKYLKINYLVYKKHICLVFKDNTT